MVSSQLTKGGIWIGSPEDNEEVSYVLMSTGEETGRQGTEIRPARGDSEMILGEVRRRRLLGLCSDDGLPGEIDASMNNTTSGRSQGQKMASTLQLTDLKLPTLPVAALKVLETRAGPRCRRASARQGD